MKAEKQKKIIVAGDVSVDWYEIPVPAQDDIGNGDGARLNWQLYPGSKMISRCGGALLLAEAVAQTCQSLKIPAEIISHHLTRLSMIPPEKVIHSLISLDEYPKSADAKKDFVYRVEKTRGFCGHHTKPAKPLPISGDVSNADVLVFDDVGNGFRDSVDVWKKTLDKNTKKSPFIILKTSRPLCQGKLWALLQNDHAEKLVVVVRADDLRMSGANISRSLSWERTAQDFVRQMTGNPDLLQISKCGNLIVLFDLDGAIHVSKSETGIETRLFYDPSGMEGEFQKQFAGDMIGYTNLFTASLTAHIAKGGIEDINKGIITGIRNSRNLLREGFGRNPFTTKWSFVFKDDQSAGHIAQTMVPELKESASWSILRDMKAAKLELIAYQIVTEGENAALKDVPMAKFGSFKTVDRFEIESFRSVKNLLVQYLNNNQMHRPLSIAVFGPPGSGKSFGVTEIAKSIAESEAKKIAKIELNISQFGSPDDLIKALHRVRDESLEGKLPLVFFDEFDSSYQGKLGWLKYFLAPMQDGAFQDGEAMHPIGRAIFVFAGGTSDTFEKFCREDAEQKNDETDKKIFRDAKGTDFVSRLRGYVNILGPNQVDNNDNFFMIRRAMLLRSFLSRQAGHLFDSKGHALIDQNVLRSFLKVPKYKHGARSMQAIIEMSLLVSRKAFEQSALPSARQLELHVDSDQFIRLVSRDVLFGTVREELGMAIHEYFRAGQKGKDPKDPAMQLWDALREDLKESNRQQGDDMPVKLMAIKCGFEHKSDKDTGLVVFTPEEIELLAVMEHERWNLEKFQGGWRFGEEKDAVRKTHPYLLPWNELTENIKDLDRNTVKEIPVFMDKLGFHVYRFD